MLGYLSADIICSEKRTVFRERSSRKTRSSQFSSSFALGNCSLLGTDNVQGHISEHIFKAKLRLLCLLSFKYFSQQAGSASPSYVNTSKFVNWLPKPRHSIFISRTEFRTDFASVKRICLEKKYNISVKGKHTFLIVWIQVADTIYKQLTVKSVNSV